MVAWQIRPALPDELAEAFAIFRDYEFLDDPAPQPFVVPDFFPHVARTGRVLVAADGARIVGYAGAITRGDVTFLTDLFVRPAAQSGSIGRALLAAICPRRACGAPVAPPIRAPCRSTRAPGCTSGGRNSRSTGRRSRPTGWLPRALRWRSCAPMIRS